jgi:hypothetical protein
MFVVWGGRQRTWKKKSENFYELGDGKTVGKNTNLIVQLCGTSHETHVDFISE